MTELERQQNGKLYNPFKVHLPQYREKKELVAKFNASTEGMKRMEYLRSVFARMGKRAYVEPPFYCDHGWKISVGENFYANTGFLVLDEADVIFGDNVFLGPRVCIYTATHPIDAELRNTGLEVALPVKIGNDVWIGGNVVINPGITIGSNVVIGSGSVVTKDIPDGVIAVGNPCRVLRAINDADRLNWKSQYEDYINDMDCNKTN
jgi:maltose O-acetyltransferase